MEKHKRSNKLNMHHGAFSRSLLVDRIRKINRENLYKAADITRSHKPANRAAR
jgi:hypothetical protein